jgi:hypothetical protein
MVEMKRGLQRYKMKVVLNAQESIRTPLDGQVMHGKEHE